MRHHDTCPRTVLSVCWPDFRLLVPPLSDNSQLPGQSPGQMRRATAIRRNNTMMSVVMNCGRLWSMMSWPGMPQAHLIKRITVENDWAVGGRAVFRMVQFALWRSDRSTRQSGQHGSRSQRHLRGRKPLGGQRWTARPPPTTAHVACNLTDGITLRHTPYFCHVYHLVHGIYRHANKVFSQRPSGVWANCQVWVVYISAHRPSLKKFLSKATFWLLALYWTTVSMLNLLI